MRNLVLALQDFLLPHILFLAAEEIKGDFVEQVSIEQVGQVLELALAHTYNFTPYHICYNYGATS